MELAISMAQWIETYGQGTVLAAGGGLIGLSFGFWAQRSRFCLWVAVIGVRLMVLMGWLDTGSAK